MLFFMITMNLWYQRILPVVYLLLFYYCTEKKANLKRYICAYIYFLYLNYSLSANTSLRFPPRCGRHPRKGGSGNTPRFSPPLPHSFQVPLQKPQIPIGCKRSPVLSKNSFLNIQGTRQSPSRTAPSRVSELHHSHHILSSDSHPSQNESAVHSAKFR